MKYTYKFYNTPELIVAKFEVNEPLPQIVVGNEFLLTTDDYSDPRLLVVRGVRVVVSHLSGQFVRYEIHVVCLAGESSLGI